MAPDRAADACPERLLLASRTPEAVSPLAAPTLPFRFAPRSGHSDANSDFLKAAVGTALVALTEVFYTVTKEETDTDVVKVQIYLLEDAVIGTPDQARRCRKTSIFSGKAISRPVTTENPKWNRASFPDCGRITRYRGATGFDVRLDTAQA